MKRLRHGDRYKTETQDSLINADVNEDWAQDQEYSEYWVSTKGRVWSNVSNSFIYGSPYDAYGHIGLTLWVDKRKVFKALHRMVAEAFIPNPRGLPQVRHLDDDPTNNNVWNLAWGSPADNTQDCIRNGHFYYLTDNDREISWKKTRVPIVAVDLSTRREYLFESLSEASRRLGVNKASISSVLHGRYSNAGGYYFYRSGDTINIDVDNYRYTRRYGVIRATELSTRREFIFHSQAEAARVLCIGTTSVSKALNNTQTACGYKFEYVDKEECRNGAY